MTFKTVFIGAVVSIALATPSLAQANCWSPAAVTGARIKAYDTMLMVGALKCRLKDQNVLARYNGFVRQSRPVLQAANEALRDHFADQGGLNAYDRYATSMANHFGGDVMGTDCSRIAEALADNVDPAMTLIAMEDRARLARLPLYLPGGICPSRVAFNGD